MTVKVSSKYQVVIPREVRKTLSIRPGAKIEVVVKGGVAYLVPVESLAQLRTRFRNVLNQKGVRDKRDRL